MGTTRDAADRKTRFEVTGTEAASAEGGVPLAVQGCQTTSGACARFWAPRRAPEPPWGPIRGKGPERRRGRTERGGGGRGPPCRRLATQVPHLQRAPGGGPRGGCQAVPAAPDWRPQRLAGRGSSHPRSSEPGRHSDPLSWPHLSVELETDATIASVGVAAVVITAGTRRHRRPAGQQTQAVVGSQLIAKTNEASRAFAS